MSSSTLQVLGCKAERAPHDYSNPPTPDARKGGLCALTHPSEETASCPWAMRVRKLVPGKNHCPWKLVFSACTTLQTPKDTA